MSDVAEIRPLQPRFNLLREPVPELIASLSALLAQAQAGEIQALSVVCVDRDGRGSYEIIRPPHVGYVDLIAHGERLRAAIMKCWDDS